MRVTRVLKKTRIARLFVGISVREVSRSKGGVYSFLTVYNTSYVVKKAAELWAKECENGVEKKSIWLFFNQNRLGNDFAGL